MYKLLLCCASGVTTNMLVSAIKESAKEQGIALMCWAAGAMAMSYSWPDADCVLVAPQSRAEYASIKEMVHGSIPVDMIDDEDFIKMNGEAILKHVIELIDQK